MWIIIVGIILLICYAVFNSIDWEDSFNEDDLPWKGFTDHE